MAGLELKRPGVPPTPQLKDLTAEECAFLKTGGQIEHELINERWVKRRIPAGSLARRAPLAKRRSAPGIDHLRLKLQLLELSNV